MTQLLSLYRGLIEVPDRAPTMGDVVAQVAERTGFTPEQIRTARYVRGYLRDARQAAMHGCYALGRSNMQVARYFGLTDHTAVIHARQQHETRMGETRQAEAA